MLIKIVQYCVREVEKLLMAPLYCFLTFLWTGFTAELGYVGNLYIFYDKAPPYSFCFPEQE